MTCFGFSSDFKVSLLFVALLVLEAFIWLFATTRFVVVVFIDGGT